VLTPFALLPSSKLNMRRVCVWQKPVRQTEFQFWPRWSCSSERDSNPKEPALQVTPLALDLFELYQNDEVRRFGEKCRLRAQNAATRQSPVQSPFSKSLRLLGDFRPFHRWRNWVAGVSGGGRGTGVEPSPRSPAYSSELWRRGFWQGHEPKGVPSPLAAACTIRSG
jgi:hypothetical protein